MVRPWKARAWELYDLETDPFEGANRASQNPKILQRLLKQWEQWAEDAAADCAAVQKQYPQ